MMFGVDFGRWWSREDDRQVRRGTRCWNSRDCVWVWCFGYGGKKWEGRVDLG